MMALKSTFKKLKHLGFEDRDYETVNVKIYDNEKLVFENSEILFSLICHLNLTKNINQNKTLLEY